MTTSVPTGIIPAVIIHKLRTRIIPLVLLGFFVAFLDRINIGFAALTMNEALHITKEQFGLLSGIFFLGYFFFEIPSNLLLHKIGARVWITRIMISWGVVAVLSGFVHNVPSLCVLRFLLGMAEAGFFPGILLYLTYWFRQQEYAQAVALFLAAIPAANVLGAPVSGFILDHVHWLGVDSWRWLLVIEGIPAIGCGIVIYLLLPSRPEDARFLTQDEKDWITLELSREEKQKLGQLRISALRALTNGRVWYLACVLFTLLIGFYAVSFWLPQVVKSLSRQYSNTTIGILVMIPHLAGLLAMILVSQSSDSKLERRFHAAIPTLVAGIALFLLGTTNSLFGSIVLFSLVAMGTYSVFGPFWSLPSEFLTGFSAASGIALIASIGNLGGFVGPYAIGAISQRTGSVHGNLAFAAIPLLLSATLILFLPKKTWLHSR
ncbi:MAG TPA: MFS transporter [Candidatus Acidoferrum sp.]|nr:MFS transporter [Candidatus Acidoferrum sp.]